MKTKPIPGYVYCMRRKLTKAIEKAQKEMQTVTFIAQTNCKHKYVGEYDGCNSPRVCMTCGLQECLGGPGWVILKSTTIRKISEEEFMRRGLGKVIRLEHKGDLLTGKITLKEFLGGVP